MEQETLLQNPVNCINTSNASKITITKKSAPQMGSITPRLLLKMLPWVSVEGGVYRVNRTQVKKKNPTSVEIEYNEEQPSVTAASLSTIPVFAGLDNPTLELLTGIFDIRELGVDENLVAIGDSGQKFFIVVRGEVELIRKGAHGEELRIGLISAGEYFGQTELLSEETSNVEVHALTSSVFLVLDRDKLKELINSHPELGDQLKKSTQEYLDFLAKEYQINEMDVNVISEHGEEEFIPHTYIQYEDTPREYTLNSLQTILRVHTRVSDLYNDPYYQLEEQMRLSIEALQEREEWDMINSKNFGLLANVSSNYRIRTRYGAPTPDDLDDLISLVWKAPSFFIAHPRAIAAFERECTWRGVPPVTTNLYGVQVITWRGIPLIPSDKMEVKPRTLSSLEEGITNILLVRVGEQERGVVGLHHPGLPGEVMPSLTSKLMSVDNRGIASYLLTKYFSLATLTEDAIGVLENVEVGYYHDYQQRNLKLK